MSPPTTLRRAPGSRAYWLIGIALLIGIAERVGWALARKNGSATGEAFNVAVAIARGRGFADAFAVGQGPTAHLMPLPPMFAGGVYALFGVQSVTAETLLLIWALGLTFGTYALFAGVARRIGVPAGACLAGFAFLCVAPIFTTTEAFDFRAWEGGMTMTTAGAFLILLLRADAGEPMSAVARITLWALPALVMFLQPMIGLAAGLALALLMIRQWRGWRAAAVSGLPFVILFAALFGTWAARNMAVMGEPIWLRDNLGLELAVGNHAGAVNPADPDAAFDARLAQIHPFVSADAYATLQRVGGEAAYARKMGAETKAWMAAHPGDTARLWVGHMRQIVVPAVWQFKTAHNRVMPVIRTVLLDIVGIAGLIGFALLLWTRRRTALYIAPFIVVPILLYMPFQPVQRYMWLVYSPLTYLAAYAANRLISRSPQSA
jgi:hypothetical protein